MLFMIWVVSAISALLGVLLCAWFRASSDYGKAFLFWLLAILGVCMMCYSTFAYYEVI